MYPAFPTATGNRATFTGLMELYEHNYILLKLLFGSHDLCDNVTIDRSTQRYRLQLTPLERGHYTTTALLTYSLLDCRRRVLIHIVQLKIRIYRDTRQAELFRPDKYLRSLSAGHGTNRVIVVRSALNRFLNKFLETIWRRETGQAGQSHLQV